MTNQLNVPDIGDFEQVEIVEVIVKVGEKIKKNDPVVTLESDKSSVEVPSEIEGVVSNINVKVGDKVSKGDLILEVNAEQKNDAEELKVKKDKIPKDTENLIREAEKSIEKKEKIVDTPIKIASEKYNLSKNNEDIDVTETKEWIDSL